MKWNLRHLRVFLAVEKFSSATRAAQDCNLSQPAVTQAINKLESEFSQQLFQHLPHGLFTTPAGELFSRRVKRALILIDEAVPPIAPRLAWTATSSQLDALIAVNDKGNFTLAAKQLGLAQPTVHRAVSHLESEAGKALFVRTSSGIKSTRACKILAEASQLAFAELDQAIMELAELNGTEIGMLKIGSLPLARSFVLPHAITEFRKSRPKISIKVDESHYDTLLTGLRRGEIDFLIGALRDPLPIEDIKQTKLFTDDLILIAGPTHPLIKQSDITLKQLSNYPWVIARSGTPTRAYFDKLFSQSTSPENWVETGSLILMRQLLQEGAHIGCISRLQAAAEIKLGLMVPIKFDLKKATRPIGITTRVDWLPTKAQQSFIDEIVSAAAIFSSSHNASNGNS